MDGIIKQIGGLIKSTFNSVVQADDNQPEKHIFYYENHPVTEKSFNALKEIAFEVYFDTSCTTETDEASKELSKSLYPIWKEQFHRDHAEETQETTAALAKIAKRYITVYHTANLQRVVAIEYNDTIAQFADGMALLLFDIDRAHRKPYDYLDEKQKKIQW